MEQYFDVFCSHTHILGCSNARPPISPSRLLLVARVQQPHSSLLSVVPCFPFLGFSSQEHVFDSVNGSHRLQGGREDEDSPRGPAYLRHLYHDPEFFSLAQIDPDLDMERLFMATLAAGL